MKVFGPLLHRLGGLFRPSREEVEEGGDEAIEELWAPDRLEAKGGRFEEERGPTWASTFREGRLDLELAKTGLLAWASAPGRIYDDFFVEAGISFPPGEDYVAAGLMFRQAEEDDFYLLLISSRGYLRLDVVFNGRPRPLVGWTELPWRLQAPRAEASLRLIAQGNRFTIFVDGEWVAEAEDETSRQGGLAFVGRSFDEGSALPHRFSLTSILLESRKIEVEALRRRFTLLEKPGKEARRRLAETFVAMGHYLPAAVQVKKMAESRPLDARELLLKAEIELRLELLDDAQASLDASLALAPGNREAILEKANLLYRRNLFPELRSFVESLGDASDGEASAGENSAGPGLAGESRIPLLLGHAHASLGDWGKAAEAYGKAAALEPEEPLLRKNEARALEMAGKKAEAREAWVEAGKRFFAREEVAELALAEANLLRLDRGGAGHAAIKTRLLFLEKKNRECLSLAETLIDKGSEDASVAYVAGILRAAQGDREAAAAHFERAHGLEPEEALFAWRRAENLWLLGSPEAPRLVEEALARHPDDGWTLNLAARLDIEALEAEEGRGSAEERRFRIERAAERLERAVAALPSETAPLFNLAELRSVEGRTEEALALLTPYEDSAEARNLAGNILTRAAQEGGTMEGGENDREARFLSAEREYRRAVALDPSRGEFRENLAGLLVELGRWSDAEAELARALELGSGARAYLLMGNLAELLGDWPRAEASYRVGLETHRDEPSLLLALGRLWILRRDWKRAHECEAKLSKIRPGTAALLEAEILEASTDKLACSSCGREWRTPRDLPAQSGSNIRGMPPDEAPAGVCPSCGKHYCIACAKEHLEGNRFTCPDCGEYLKLSDNRLRWLVRQALREAEAAGRAK